MLLLFEFALCVCQHDPTYRYRRCTYFSDFRGLSFQTHCHFKLIPQVYFYAFCRLDVVISKLPKPQYGIFSLINPFGLEILNFQTKKNQPPKHKSTLCMVQDAEEAEIFCKIYHKFYISNLHYSVHIYPSFLFCGLITASNFS